MGSHAYTWGDVGKVCRRGAVLPAAGSQPQRIFAERDQCEVRLLADRPRQGFFPGAADWSRQAAVLAALPPAAAEAIFSSAWSMVNEAAF